MSETTMTELLKARIPGKMKREIQRRAKARLVSEADIVREAIQSYLLKNREAKAA